MKMFISGPIEDTPLNRLKRFDEIKRFLESKDYEVVTEIDIPYPELKDDMDHMIDECQKEPDLVTWLVLSLKKVWIMAQCDALFLLPNWQECHASIILFVAARKLDMPVYVDDGSAIKLVNEDEVKNWFQKQIKTT